MQLRLLVREMKEPAAKSDTPAGAGAERPAAAPRPALKVLQGGAPRRSRPARPAIRLTVAPPSPTKPDPRAEEIPVYLRPIPSWVPRLW